MAQNRLAYWLVIFLIVPKWGNQKYENEYFIYERKYILGDQDELKRE